MGGVLVLGDDDLSTIKSSMKNWSWNIEKCHAYLASLIEFGYDLAIQFSMNVSSNPGFKLFVGVF